MNPYLGWFNIFESSLLSRAYPWQVLHLEQENTHKAAQNCLISKQLPTDIRIGILIRTLILL